MLGCLSISYSNNNYSALVVASISPKGLFWSKHVKKTACSEFMINNIVLKTFNCGDLKQCVF